MRWCILFGHAGQMAALFFIVLPFISHSVHITLAEGTALLCYLFGLHTFFLSLKQDRIRKPRSISRRIAEILLRAVLFSGSAVLIVFTEWRLLTLIGILFLIFAFVRGLTKAPSFSAFEAEVTEEKKQVGACRACDDDEPGGGNPKVKDRMRRKPLLYRNSRRIFKSRTVCTGYKELFLKSC